MRDVFAALISRPKLLRSTINSAIRGAERGVREDASLGWYMSGRRLRRAAPDAATGALWYGDEEFVETVAPYLTSQVEALEIGAGAGRVSRLVAPRVKRLVLTDISEPLIDEAREHLAGMSDVDFAVLDCTRLHEAFPADNFDLIFAHDVFVTIDSDPSLAILDSAAKILRPGGHLAASFLTIDIEESGREQLRLVREAAAKGRFGISHPRTYTEAQVRAIFELAGFQVVSASYAKSEEHVIRPHFTVIGQLPGS